MMKLLAAVTLALCLAAVCAQTPPRCVTPPMWEARVLMVDPAKSYETLALVSYDATNQRYVRREEVFQGDTREYYEEIFLHREKLGYKINLRTKQCYKFALTEPFNIFGVPLNATFYGEAYVGSDSFPGSGVLVSMWGGESTRGRYNGVWSIAGCVPITDSYVSSTSGFIHWTFFDVTTGISNPNVFIPPSECS